MDAKALHRRYSAEVPSGFGENRQFGRGEAKGFFQGVTNAEVIISVLPCPIARAIVSFFHRYHSMNHTPSSFSLLSHHIIRKDDFSSFQ